MNPSPIHAQYRCPRCHGSNLRGAKFGMGNGSLVEFGCLDCHLFEDKWNRDPDYWEWKQRWYAPQQTQPGKEPRSEPPATAEEPAPGRLPAGTCLSGSEAANRPE